MTSIETRPGSDASAAQTHAVLVTADAHISPRVREDLLSYCPKAYRKDYAGFLAQKEASGGFDGPTLAELATPLD